MEWLKNFYVSYLLFLYTIPVIVNALGYLIRTVKAYNKAVKRRDEGEYFQSETVGTIVARVIVSFLPVINIFSGIFSSGPEIVAAIYEHFSGILDIPLVKDLPKEAKVK